MRVQDQRLQVSARKCRCSPQHRVERSASTIRQVELRPVVVIHSLGYIEALFLFLIHLGGLWLAFLVCGRPVVANLTEVVELRLHLAVGHMFAAFVAASAVPAA
jgi:hypothetical protein